MIVKGIKMPPDDSGWLEGVNIEKLDEAQDVFLARMYLQLDSDDPEDSILLFQEVFSQYLRNPIAHIRTLENIFYLVQSQLNSFDDWFCDLVYCRFFELCKDGQLKSRLRKCMKTYDWSLMSRGYELPEAWRFSMAKKWNAVGPPKEKPENLVQVFTPGFLKCELNSDSESQ